MSRIRVMLADDHRTVREGLRLLVGAQPDMEVVGEAEDGREAARLAQQLAPDVLVMDVSMPSLNGLKATRMITESCPAVRVLTLTRHKDGGYLQELLRAGASGYVLKQSASTVLLHAIRAVAAGGKYLDPAIAEQITTAYASRGPRPRGEAAKELSERETEVLRLIAWGHSNKEIAARLDLSVKTVEVHKANAMKRLGITSRIGIVRYAILQGWLQDN